MKRFFSAATLAFSTFALPVVAQTCGGTYSVRGGDSLSVISDRLYKDVGKWSAIHTHNINVIGQNPNALRVGMKLNIPCLDGLPTGLEGGASLQATSAPQPRPSAPRPAATGDLPLIKVVTADDFPPFTHRGLLGDGLLAEMMNASFDAAVSDEGYDVFWVNDWSSHLDPMLSSQIMDVAFPWAKPDCASTPDLDRCVNFHFSEPMFEYLVLMFVNKSTPIPFSSDSDVEGRTLCRPKGYTTHMLDQDGRNWLKDGKITLKQPQDVHTCFEMLDEGEVEGVVLNEFTARALIKEMGLKDKIEAVPTRPVSITSLHALVHKNNPNAEALLEAVNGGLEKIKETGEYQTIVNTHMSSIWANF